MFKNRPALVGLTTLELGGKTKAVFIWHNTLTALKEVYDSLPPAGEMPATVIAFTNDEAGIDFFQDFFRTVVPVKKVFNPYAMFDKDSWQTIYICKDAKENFAGMREAFKSRVFE